MLPSIGRAKKSTRLSFQSETIRLYNISKQMLKESVFLLCFSIFLVVRIDAFQCSSADMSQCGEGICTDFKWVGGVCSSYSLSYCLEGTKWSNETSVCISCANLSPTQCQIYCSDYYVPTGSGSANNSSIANSSISNSSTGCASCRRKFGQGCSSCNAFNCLSCDNSENSLNLAADMSHCFHTLCSLPNCYLCATNASCAVCRTGFDLALTGNCTPATCEVPYCSQCLLSVCVSCSAGYLLTESGVACKLVCSDPNCLLC